MTAYFESVRFFVRFFQRLKYLQLLGFSSKGWTEFDEFLSPPLDELFHIDKYSKRQEERREFP